MTSRSEHLMLHERAWLWPGYNDFLEELIEDAAERARIESALRRIRPDEDRPERVLREIR